MNLYRGMDKLTGKALCPVFLHSLEMNKSLYYNGVIGRIYPSFIPIFNNVEVKKMPLPDKEMDKIFLIGIGGFLGAICRFLFCELVEGELGTLSVNVLGSFMLGMIMYDTEYLGLISPKGKIALGTGFMGAFTTFSTFAVQSFSMPFLPALGNISANLFLTLTGVFFGRSVIKALSSREI